MKTWNRKFSTALVLRLVSSALCLCLCVGCATVLDRRPKTQIVDTGMVKDSEIVEVPNATLKKHSSGKNELFTFSGNMERSWLEGREQHHWDVVRVRRRVAEWREGAYANAVVTMTRGDGSVSSMMMVPRDHTERRNHRVEQLPPVRKRAPVNLPLTLKIKTQDGSVLSSRRVRSGETVPFDILSAAYPFHEDFTIRLELIDDLVNINRSAQAEYHYERTELISRFLAHGQLRPEQRPNLLWHGDVQVEVDGKPNEKIEGGDRIWIELDLKNHLRAGDAFDVKVGLYERGGRHPVSQEDIAFHLKPGQKKRIRMAFPIPYAKEDYLQHLTLEATDGFGNKSPVYSFHAAVRATTELPDLHILTAQVRERPGGGGKGLEIRIRNRGNRNAEDVQIQIRNSSHSGVLEARTLTNPRIESHSQASVWVPIRANMGGDANLSFSVHVSERMGMSHTRRDIVIPAVFLK